MKTLLTDYLFTAGTRQIQFPGFTDMLQAGFLLITNTTSNVIIYNFASPLLGGTVAGNVLTLAHDTTTMADSDNLQIYYDDGLAGSSVEDDRKLNLLINLLLQKAAECPVWYDVVLNALRITGAVTVTGTLTTVSTVTTVGTLTNQTNMGGWPADMMPTNAADTDWALTTRNFLTT